MLEKLEKIARHLTDNPDVGIPILVGALLGMLILALVIFGLMIFCIHQGREFSFFGLKIGPRTQGPSNESNQQHTAPATLETIEMASRLPRNKDSITGHWEMRDWLYDYDDLENQEQLENDSKTKTYSNNATLVQHSDNRVTGSFKNKVSDYEISGKVEGRVFTGNWREVNPALKTQWHGAFQFIYKPHREGGTMSGAWVGTSADTEKRIHYGEWEWRERLEPSIESKRQWPSEAGTSVVRSPASASTWADRKYRDIPGGDSRRNAVRESHWRGCVNQLRGPSGGQEEYPFELHLSIGDKIVSGTLVFTYKERETRCSVRGGFIEGRFLQLEYQDEDPITSRYGTMFLTLGPDGESLAGHFLGFAPELNGVANGELRCGRTSLTSAQPSFGQ